MRRRVFAINTNTLCDSSRCRVRLRQVVRHRLTPSSYAFLPFSLRGFVDAVRYAPTYWLDNHGYHDSN